MSRADPQRLADYLQHILEAIDIVWQTIQHDLAPLRAQIAALLQP